MDESPSYMATFMQQPGRTVVDMPLSVLMAQEAAARLWVWWKSLANVDANIKEAFI